MSNEKQTPCEAAWKQWYKGVFSMVPKEGDVGMLDIAFSAGFLAGESGKKELLEALKELKREADVNCCSTDGYERSKKAFAKASATIAKHTAK